MIKPNWICTDSDNEQYGRKIANGVYEFKEKNRGLSEYEPEEFIEISIFLAQYSEEKINSHISAYYDSIDQIKRFYGDDWEWIVAECIFEQESGLY